MSASSEFADAGKAVRTGHSRAAVTGHEPPFRLQSLGAEPIFGKLRVKAGARCAELQNRQVSNLRSSFRNPARNPESEHLAANAHPRAVV